MPFSGIPAFTGCITIEENYAFKKNGSGTMEYVIDLSELGDMMKTLNSAGDGEPKSDGDISTMDMNDEVAALKGIPGIGKVKLNTKKAWVQRLSFSFKNVTALNAALNVLMPDSTGVAYPFFKWEGKARSCAPTTATPTRSVQAWPKVAMRRKEAKAGMMDWT